MTLREALDGSARGRRPRRLDRAIERGLRADPATRWASVEQLRGQLLACRRRGGPGWIAAALAVGAAAVAGATARDVADPGPCSALQARAAEVWSDERRASVRSALDAKGVGAGGRALASIDAYAQRWHAHAAGACEGEVSPAEVACLRRRVEQLDQFASALESAPSVDPSRVLWAAANLSADFDCGLALEHSPASMLQDPGVAQGHAQVRAAWAQHAAGDILAARRIADQALDQARSTGDVELLAITLYRRGRIAMDSGEVDAAVALLEEAQLVALEARAQPLAARAAASLVGALIDAGRPADALRHARHGFERSRRSGQDDLARASAYSALSAALEANGDVVTSVVHMREALRIRQVELGSNAPLVGDSHHDLGAALLNAGNNKAALAELARAEAVYERWVGPAHPKLAALAVNRGHALEVLGRVDEAARSFERAVEVLRAIDPTHPGLVGALGGLGTLAYGGGDFAGRAQLVPASGRGCPQQLGVEQPRHGGGAGQPRQRGLGPGSLGRRCLRPLPARARDLSRGAQRRPPTGRRRAHQSRRHCSGERGLPCGRPTL